MFAQGGSSSKTSSRLDSDQSRPSSPRSKSPVKANVYGTTRGPVASAFGRASIDPPSRCALRRAGGRIPSADTSACARASVASGASRPKTTPSGPALRSISSAPSRSGTQYRKLNGNWKPSGMTPTTVCTSSPSRSSRPMTSRAPAKRRCQTSWPMTMTGAAPGAASASTIGRPMQRRHPRDPEPGGRDLGDRHEFDRSVGRDDVAPDRLEGADIIDRLQAGRANARCPATPCPAAGRPRGPTSGWRRPGRPRRAEADST